MPALAQLAELVGGTIKGDAAREIVDLADLQHAGPEHLSFLANAKYEGQFLQSRAGAILVNDTATAHPSASLVVCADPYLAMAQLAQHLHPPPRPEAGVTRGALVHPKADVDPSAHIGHGAVIEVGATVGPRTVIMPQTYVGAHAKIGADCLLYPGVKVLDRCVVGDRVTLHAGVVVGSDGFGYAVGTGGKREKIPQVGIVVVEEDVEIGANTTVDRATFGETRIGRGTKIDNLVQIAHNVTTGEHCVIVSQTGIAGSAELGDRVVVGAQGGIAGHLSITDDVMLAARSGVSSTVKKSGIYAGAPITEHRHWLRTKAAQRSLPEMRKKIQQLQEEIAALRVSLNEKDSGKP